MGGRECLLSILDNIKTVRFYEKDYDMILAIQSTEGESVDVSCSSGKIVRGGMGKEREGRDVERME